MTREINAGATIDACVFGARVPAARPVLDYTPRLIPHNDEAIVLLEASHILWQGRARRALIDQR